MAGEAELSLSAAAFVGTIVFLAFFVRGVSGFGSATIAIPLLALWGCAGPATQALVTRQVDPSEQGRLQGALAGLTSLAGIIGPALYTQTFGWSIAPGSPLHLPGAAFLVAALLLVVAFVLAWKATHPRMTPAAVAAADPVQP